MYRINTFVEGSDIFLFGAQLSKSFSFVPCAILCSQVMFRTSKGMKSFFHKPSCVERQEKYHHKVMRGMEEC